MNIIKECLRFVYYYIYKTVWLEFWRGVYKITIGGRYFKNISSFKGIHEGKRCFIVATGPSLQVDELTLLKDEYTFTVNSGLFLMEQTDWIPTYYAIQDREVYEKIKDRLGILRDSQVISFFGDTLLVDKNPVANYYSLKHQRHLIRSGKSVKFSSDISKCIYDGWTITYSAIQIAVYMGFKEIYLLGCDSDYSGKKRHIVSYEKGKKDSGGNASFGYYSGIAYAYAQEYALKHDLKIINCTNGGKLEAFPRMKLTDVLRKENG